MKNYKSVVLFSICNISVFLLDFRIVRQKCLLFVWTDILPGFLNKTNTISINDSIFENVRCRRDVSWEIADCES